MPNMRSAVASTSSPRRNSTQTRYKNGSSGVQKQGSGTAWGIFLGGVSGGLAVNNRITNADVGIDFSNGGSTGKYRDNLTTNVGTPFSGGTAVGTNN